MAAGYRFDDRVTEMLEVLAAAVLAGAQEEAAAAGDSMAALRRLEDLHVVAAHTEAGVPPDDRPLCDPAGITAVTTLWQAITAELGEEGWEHLTNDWRRR